MKTHFTTLRVKKMSAFKITPFSLSSSTNFIKHSTINPNFHHCRSSLSKTLTYFNGVNHTSRRSFVVSMSTNPLQICVKQSVTYPNKLGECPFCQRVLLTLEEKHLPYDMKFVDMTNKPEWFLKINPEGIVPVINLDEKWVTDSTVIVNSLEEKYPNPPLATPSEKATVGSKIFSAFYGFFNSKDPSDGKEQELLNELTSFNDYLKENGPLINGEQICAADLSLGIKLYYMEIVLGHYKNWSVPDSLGYVMFYMKTIFSRDSFKKTMASPEDVIVGWGRRISLKHSGKLS